MQLFHRIDDAEAVIRVKGGTFKQVPMYRRGERVYVACSGGYVRVTSKFGDSWGTSNPNVNVLNMPSGIPNLIVNPGSGTQEPRWIGGANA